MVEGFSSKKIVCVYLEIKIKEVERPVLSNFHLYKKEDENIHENVNLGYWFSEISAPILLQT